MFSLGTTLHDFLHFRLIPNTLLLFSANDTPAPLQTDINYLKEDLLMLVQAM